MKKHPCSLAALFSLLLSLTATGQQPPALSIDSLAAKEVRLLKAKLQLDSVQQINVFNAFKVLYTTNATGITDPAARPKKIREAQQAYERSLKRILTNSQYKEYEDLSTERNRHLARHQQQKPKERVELKK